MVTDKKFKALVVAKDATGKFTDQVKDRIVSELPEGDVLVRVCYSSLNYKDALSATGNPGVTKHYPHTPGIDAAGVVEQSNSAQFAQGDEVIVTSYDLGMNTSGGFAEFIRVPSGWVVPMVSGLDLKKSMVYGTAGFTAGMSVFELIKRVRREDGDILVTGATGGVGSLAVAMLAKLGFSVTAVSGKVEAEGFLKKLGATAVIVRDEVTKGNERPLLKTRWAGVVDTVGGQILAAAVKSTQMQGVVTCCGNVASPELDLTVFPFILRGVSLVGIDSQNCPMEHRQKIWQHIGSAWQVDEKILGEMSRLVDLNGLTQEIKTILEGGQVGRVVVDLQ